MNNKLEEIEKDFIKWAEDRDDDWWENGNGHFSIWDFRIMADFFLPRIEQAYSLGKEEGVREGEEEHIRAVLRRININESNAYPIIDESESLKDVKESLINRLGQISSKKINPDDFSLGKEKDKV